MDRRDVLKLSMLGTAAAGLGAAACSGSAPTPGNETTENVPDQRSNTTLPDDALFFSESEYAKRYEAIRTAMDAADFDVLVFFGSNGWYRGDGGNMRYVAGDSAVVDFDPNYVVFPKAGTPVLAGHSMSIARAKRDPGISPLLDKVSADPRSGGGHRADGPKLIRDLIKRIGFANSKIGIVGMRIFPAETFAALLREFPFATFEDAENLVNAVRRTKSVEEIAFLKKSGQAADVAMAAMIDAISSGATPRDLMRELDLKFRTLNCESGLQIVWGQPWEPAQHHSHDPNRPFQPGDFIANEITSNYKGYYTQLAVPIVYQGEPPQSLLDAIALNSSIYEACKSSLRPGTTVAELDTQCRELVKELSGDDWFAPFLCQTVDFEQSFLHAPNPIEIGSTYILMPWLLWNQGVQGFGKSDGYVGHVAGNTLVCTDAEPIELNASALDLIIIE